MNVSKDTHPILDSIRILPKFNPHISYACLTAVYNSTNIILPADVKAYAARCKEIVNSSYQAKLSYYQSAQDRCIDESLVTGVIEAHEHSLQQSPRTPRELSPSKQSSSFSIRQSFRSLFHSKSAKLTQSHSEPNLQSPLLKPPSFHIIPPPHTPQEVSPVPSVTKHKRSDTCSTRFLEQVETSLFNLSRIATLTALQFKTVLYSEHCDVSTYDYLS